MTLHNRGNTGLIFTLFYSCEVNRLVACKIWLLCDVLHGICCDTWDIPYLAETINIVVLFICKQTDQRSVNAVYAVWR